jgi:hypothetical protein
MVRESFVEQAERGIANASPAASQAEGPRAHLSQGQDFPIAGGAAGQYFRAPISAPSLPEGPMLRIVALLLALAGAARAQSTQLFYMGSVDFHYSQLFGPFNGDFHVEGAIDTTQWIPELDEGLGGIIASSDSLGNEQLLALAAKRNIAADTTYHVFGVYYRAVGAIQAGAVPNPLSTVQLFLIWNMDSLAWPTELPDSLNIADILGAISAEHKFVGFASSMNISTRNETTLDFTFSGTALDLDNSSIIIFLTNGTAHMVGNIVSAVDEPSARPRATLALAPNPFNPGTTLRYALPRPGLVRLRVHDLRGRLVDQIELGWQPTGEHQAFWTAGAGAAGAQASGLLLLSLTLDGQPLERGRGLLLK